ncbi:unnamed protein product [Rangifer tarandus platyrhynchus]|uniref:Uncharacterized protein n=2 Tax=Rangifer tarandus platyrhynchus TaxID=3082113 RepID=A0AC59ZCJ6_RANTA|nr:unnamed protein product [Rangifer tarandus platyrhynchus]
MIALERAACQGDIRVLQLRLYRQGGVNATQTLIRHLQELERSRSRGTGVSVDALTSALQLWAGENPGPRRARRSPSVKDCEQEQEQSVHNIAQMLPGVGTFYNLGTAVYYAVRNCSDMAKERGRDGVIDLGYDLLMAMAGTSGGPTGLKIGTALKPALKAGVPRLTQYYYEREANTPPPETSEEVLGSTSDMSGVEETTVTAPPCQKQEVQIRAGHSASFSSLRKGGGSETPAEAEGVSGGPGAGTLSGDRKPGPELLQGPGPETLTRYWP